MPSTNDFAEIRSAGFTLVCGPADKAYLDAARAAHLKVLASPSGHSQNYGAGINSLDRHPALWAWYLFDEPDMNLVPPTQVAAAHQNLKRLGARKPTALVLFQGYEARNYGNITDILMVDRYPIPWLPLANFGQHVQMARLATPTHQPLMAVIQAFDWSSYPELLTNYHGNFRPPTCGELRCMTYEALARGANGIFFYEFDGRWKIREHADLWNCLKAVVREVSERSPLFAGTPLWWPKEHEFGDPNSAFNAALQSSVTSTLLRVKDSNPHIPAGDYIVAVNNTPQDLCYSFLVPAQDALAPVSVLGEDRAVVLNDGRLADQFCPYAVHVYGPLGK